MTLSMLGYCGSFLRTAPRFSSSVSTLPGARNSLIRFEPEFFSRDAKLIIPISFNRYIIDDRVSTKKTIEYDHFLNALFERTSFFLEAGIVTSVDILATGDLQRINWCDRLVDSVEQHFFEVHKKLLERQSNVHRWNQWIALRGIKIFNERYKEILSQSQPNSSWYDLMIRTQKNLKISTSIEQSVEYQRQEYTAISLMNRYTHLIYTGSMPLSWPYLCKKYDNLPFFSHVKLESLDGSNNYIKTYDIEQTTQMLLSNIKQVLTGKNFPPQSKEKFIDDLVSLIYTYNSSEDKTSLTDQANIRPAK